jgi:hypothetical protein
MKTKNMIITIAGAALLGLYGCSNPDETATFTAGNNNQDTVTYNKWYPEFTDDDYLDVSFEIRSPEKDIYVKSLSQRCKVRATSKSGKVLYESDNIQEAKDRIQSYLKTYDSQINVALKELRGKKEQETALQKKSIDSLLTPG